MFDIVIVQKVFRHYRRDFYNGLLANDDFNIICFGEKNELDELKPIFKKYKFSDFARFNIFSMDLLFGIYKSRVLIFPADLSYPQFILLGYVLSLFRKKVYFLGHFKGKRNSRVIEFLRKIYYSWPFKMLIYYESELNGVENNRVYYLNNTINTNTIDSLKPKLKRNDINDEGLNVAFIGRETGKSNYELFVKVSERLKDSDIVFKSIGPSKKGLESIEEFGPVFDESEIAKIFENVDLVFYAGDVGLSLIHSFYYAIPVLIHNNMDLHYPEVTNFEENKNGLCYEYNSIDSAVKMLTHARSNKKILLEMSKYLAHNREKYSVKKMIRNFRLAVTDANNPRN